MDGEAASLHAAEPGHLALGKLVDGNLQPAEHLVVSQTANDVLRQEFILQAIINKVIGGDALVEQCPHLVDHALFQSGFQTTRNLLPAQLAVDVDTYY